MHVFFIKWQKSNVRDEKKNWKKKEKMKKEEYEKTLRKDSKFLLFTPTPSLSLSRKTAIIDSASEINTKWGLCQHFVCCFWKTALGPRLDQSDQRIGEKHVSSAKFVCSLDGRQFLFVSLLPCIPIYMRARPCVWWGIDGDRSLIGAVNDDEGACV